MNAAPHEITAYPLAWPEGFPRTPLEEREKDRMRTRLSTAINNLRNSIRLFGKDSGSPIDPDEIIVSSNCSLAMNCPQDAGIAAYFEWEGEMRCFAVDKYRNPEANVQAIHLIIEARRVELRHGGLNLIRAAFKGFTALPAPGANWRSELGFSAGERADESAIERRFKARAKKAHPDGGGSAEAMRRLTAARETALAEARQ